MAPGGGGAAAISASSKHPFDIPSSSASGPLGAIKDPAAGPNSRPEMEGGVTSSSSPVSGSAPGSSSSKPAASPPPVATSGPTDPARGPSSTPLPDQSLAVETPTPSPAGEGPTAPLLTTMVETPSTASPRHQHPFNTYAFVSRLEAAGVRPITARTLMEGVRSLTVARSEAARARVLSTEELDNAAYRFKAALSELRTEQGVRTRNDGIAMRSAASAMRREVDNLEQSMKVDLQSMKHDIELDLNNRKADTRADMKRFDIATEEINNKFTIYLGDLRTEIESAKWDATRRAIAIIAVLVLCGITLSTFGMSSKPPPVTPVTMRDVAVGPDHEDHHEHDDTHEHDDHHAHVERHLDRLLQDKWRDREEKKEVKEKKYRDASTQSTTERI